MFDFFKRDNSKVIHVNDLDNLIGKIELVDIREPYEYKSVVNVAGGMGSYVGTKTK